MASVAGYTLKEAYKLAYSISPIILTGGLADNLPGSSLPIVAILQSLTFGVQGVASLVGQGTLSAATTPFATFEPLPGSNLIAAQIAAYPFASRAVAGNAQLTVPLQVGMRMVVPAQGEGGYAIKTANMVALRSMLNQHIALGGLFDVITPSCLYRNCVLLDLRDSTPGQTTQKQVEWVWQFQQPLTQEKDLTQVMSNLMGKISGGLPTDGLWSSVSNVVGSGVQQVESGISSVGKFLGI
ncbi:hypothetical protein [Paraburkholderia tropica]|uniref:hypothetical protein n=1 Tax=Paraburkholderia tropica TaxID=92647 RepID=UPI002AAFEE48|nr:hypothetical protein [Paraburkholderia tropica]